MEGGRKHNDELAVEISKEIVRRFPREHSDRDPFRVLIKTVLSQRTKDENTARAAERLFKLFDTPEKLMNADIKVVEDLIKPSGMFRQKARRIKEIARKIVEEYGGEVPNDLGELLQLPGVGRKTANIVLHVSFKKPAIAVDTHVHRISNRIGLVRTRTPEETERELMKILPKDLWGPINGSMVEFGRRICKPQNPLCDLCPKSIAEHCVYRSRMKKGDRIEG